MLQYLKNTLCKDNRRNWIYFWSLHQFLIPQSKYSFFFFKKSSFSDVVLSFCKSKNFLLFSASSLLTLGRKKLRWVRNPLDFKLLPKCQQCRSVLSRSRKTQCFIYPHHRDANLVGPNVHVGANDGSSGKIHALPHHVLAEQPFLFLQQLWKQKGTIKTWKYGKSDGFLQWWVSWKRPCTNHK